MEGIPESLIGHRFEAIIVEEYWYRGTLAEPANVIWLRCHAEWYELFFDIGSVFWRKPNDTPKAYKMPELSAEVRAVDLANEFGLVGEKLTTYAAAHVEDGIEVRFTFESGKSLAFRNVDDMTHYRCTA